jgi:hypothetical protein
VDPEAQLSGSGGVYPWRNNIKSLPTIPLKEILVVSTGCSNQCNVSLNINVHVSTQYIKKMK